MKHLNVVAFVVPMALALFVGCERKPSNDVVKTSDQNSSAPNVRPKASADTTPAVTDSKSEMVQIAGGRFMMGDKDEADAPPHEVTVSSFLMDRHLVTQ